MVNVMSESKKPSRGFSKLATVGLVAGAGVMAVSGVVLGALGLHALAEARRRISVLESEKSSTKLTTTTLSATNIEASDVKTNTASVAGKAMVQGVEVRSAGSNAANVKLVAPDKGARAAVQFGDPNGVSDQFNYSLDMREESSVADESRTLELSSQRATAGVVEPVFRVHGKTGHVEFLVNSNKEGGPVMPKVQSGDLPSTAKTGTMFVDDTSIYVKTSTGWKKSALGSL